MSAAADDAAFVTSRGVVPVRCDVASRRTRVTLARVGEGPLEGVFYEDAMQAFRYRGGAPLETRKLALEAIDDVLPFDDAIPLVGLVFHVSRAGSSLVVRLLACDPETVVVSESPAIDDVVMRTTHDDGRAVDHAERIADLKRVVALHARARTAHSSRLVIKLDAWHLCASALFLEAFPGVRVVVLVREPREVVASQLARRGRHLVPGLVAWERLGVRVDDVPAHDLDGFALRTLGAIYDGAARIGGHARVRVVRYEGLPGAIEAIASCFGIDRGRPEDDDTLAHVDAKDPSRAYDANADLARARALDEGLCARIETELVPRYRALDG